MAVNAVLAGCEPRYLPVLIVAVKGIAQPQFNLSGVNADALLPVVERREQLHVIVAGGPGKHSSWLPTFGAGRGRSPCRSRTARDGRCGASRSCAASCDLPGGW